jgi:hypothetical protein
VAKLRLVRFMKRFASAVLIFTSFAICLGAAERTVSPRKSWSKDSATGTWVHDPTGISLPKSIARFKQKSAEPFYKDGTGIFSYTNERGVITLYLGHRSIEGYAGKGDCTAAVRDNYVREMRQNFGKADSEASFRLKFQRGNRQGTGVGSRYHFVSVPDFSGDPAYSEVGVVLIADYLYYYRATFFDTTGLADLDAFLHAIGMKKI